MRAISLRLLVSAVVKPEFPDLRRDGRAARALPSMFVVFGPAGVGDEEIVAADAKPMRRLAECRPVRLEHLLLLQIDRETNDARRLRAVLHGVEGIPVQAQTIDAAHCNARRGREPGHAARGKVNRCNSTNVVRHVKGLLIRGEGRLLRRFWFDRVAGVRLARSQSFDNQGLLITDVSYWDEKPFGETAQVRLPSRIEITRPHDHYKLSIAYQSPADADIDREFQPEAFVLENRWQLPELDLDARQRKKTVAP